MREWDVGDVQAEEIGEVKADAIWTEFGSIPIRSLFMPSFGLFSSFGLGSTFTISPLMHLFFQDCEPLFFFFFLWDNEPIKGVLVHVEDFGVDVFDKVDGRLKDGEVVPAFSGLLVFWTELLEVLDL